MISNLLDNPKNTQAYDPYLRVHDSLGFSNGNIKDDGNIQFESNVEEGTESCNLLEGMLGPYMVFLEDREAIEVHVEPAEIGEKVVGMEDEKLMVLLPGKDYERVEEVLQGVVQEREEGAPDEDERWLCNEMRMRSGCGVERRERNRRYCDM